MNAYKVIKEYIEAKYGFKQHTAYMAEVKKLGLSMYDITNDVEELKYLISDKVEVIKDAFKYFGII